MKTIGFFEYMRKLDKLYFAACDVSTKTIRHPDLPAAIVRLKKALIDIRRYQAEVNYNKEKTK